MDDLSGISADFTGAYKKTEMIKKFPLAAQRNLTAFSSDVVKSLKASAKGRAYRFTAERRKTGTGALSRSIGQRIARVGDSIQAIIGTGLGPDAQVNRMAEKYAGIQDKGGITHPRVTPKMKGWAWYMFYQTKGDEKYKAIALTKKPILTVPIPGSLWFTSVWEHKLSFLHSTYLNDEAILRTAQQMSGGPHAD